MRPNIRPESVKNNIVSFSALSLPPVNSSPLPPHPPPPPPLAAMTLTHNKRKLGWGGGGDSRNLQNNNAATGGRKGVRDVGEREERGVKIIVRHSPHSSCMNYKITFCWSPIWHSSVHHAVFSCMWMLVWGRPTRMTTEPAVPSNPPPPPQHPATEPSSVAYSFQHFPARMATKSGLWGQNLALCKKYIFDIILSKLD